MNFHYVLFLSSLTLHLQATYPKRTPFKPTRPERIEINTIVIEQAEPNSPITLGLKKSPYQKKIASNTAKK